MKTTWCKVPDEAMAQLKAGVLSPREWHVYAVLCAMSHYETRVAFTSAPELSELSGIPPTTVKGILSRLQNAHGWICLHFKKGVNARYRIAVHLTKQLPGPASPVKKDEQMGRPRPETGRLQSQPAEEGSPDEKSLPTRDSSPAVSGPQRGRESTNREIDSPCSSRAGGSLSEKEEDRGQEGPSVAPPPPFERGESSLAEESQDRDEVMPTPPPPSQGVGETGRGHLAHDAQRWHGHLAHERDHGRDARATHARASAAPDTAGETPPVHSVPDDEFLRCLRCGDTGILSYLLRRGRREPLAGQAQEERLRCFCPLGEAADPSLPRVDDVFSPLRRHNLKIEAWLGRLCAPRGFSILVWNADEDMPEDAPHGNGRTC